MKKFKLREGDLSRISKLIKESDEFDADLVDGQESPLHSFADGCASSCGLYLDKVSDALSEAYLSNEYCDVVLGLDEGNVYVKSLTANFRTSDPSPLEQVSRTTSLLADYFKDLTSTEL